MSIQYSKMQNLDHYDKICRWFDGSLCKVQRTVPFSKYRKGDLRCIDHSSELVNFNYEFILRICQPRTFGGLDYRIIPIPTDLFGDNPVFLVLENPVLRYEAGYVDIITQSLNAYMRLFIKILHRERIYYIRTTLNRFKCIPSKWFLDEDKIVKELTPDFSNDDTKKLITLTNEVIYNPC